MEELPKVSTLLLLDGMSDKIHPFQFETRYSHHIDSPPPPPKAVESTLPRQKIEFQRGRGEYLERSENIELEHGIQIINRTLDGQDDPTDNLLLMENRRALVTKIYAKIPEREGTLLTAGTSLLDLQIHQKQKEADLKLRKERFLAEEQMSIKRKHIHNWVLQPRHTFRQSVMRPVPHAEEAELISESNKFSYKDIPVELTPEEASNLQFYTPQINRERNRYGDLKISRNKPQFDRKYTLGEEIVHLKNIQVMAHETGADRFWIAPEVQKFHQE